MDEESSLSQQSFDQENFIDKENQPDSDSSNDEADEQQRYIFQQQQYQRSQFYEQQAHRRPSTLGDEDERSAGTFGSHDEPIDEPMDEDLSSSDSKLTDLVPDYLVEKIGNERWSGVNGQYEETTGEWKEWQECTTGYNSYSKENVFILPYVSVDYQSLNISC